MLTDYPNPFSIHRTYKINRTMDCEWMWWSHDLIHACTHIHTHNHRTAEIGQMGGVWQYVEREDYSTSDMEVCQV